MTDASGQIDHVLTEDRSFPPPAEFTAKAVISTTEQYDQLCKRAIEDRDEFWREQALEHLHWFEPFGEVCRWDSPHAEWFVGGKTNASYNCLDRNIEAGLGDRTAIIWEGEPGDTRTLTYAELRTEVAKCAAALQELGIGVGDVVSIYMPMTPELAIAMLACARIGAIHSVIFAGFSAESIADRNNDAQAKLVITADGLYRRGKVLPLKETVDEALAKSPSVEKCLVLRRIGQEGVPMTAGRDVWWHDVVDKQSGDLARRPTRQRSESFHPVHLRQHRQTEGHSTHHRRLQPVGQANLPVGVRSSRRRHFLVHRRLRLDHRSQLRRLRTAVGRRDLLDVRRCAESSGRRSVLGFGRKVQSHDPVHRTDRDSRLHQVG